MRERSSTGRGHQVVRKARDSRLGQWAKSLFNTSEKTSQKTVSPYEAWITKISKTRSDIQLRPYPPHEPRFKHPWHMSLPHKDKSSPMHQDGTEPQPCGFFRLPPEIRMLIFDLIFPYTDIHLQMMHTDVKTVRLEAFPCLALPEFRKDCMCCCLYGQVSRYRHTYEKSTARGPRDTGPLTFYAVPRSTVKLSSVGLWELESLLYASKAFHQETITFLLQYRRVQLFDLYSVMLLWKVMPRTHFGFIRSVYLNAKYIAPDTDFTGPVSYVPASFQARDLALGEEVCFRPENWYVESRNDLEPARGKSLSRYPSFWHVACHMFSKMQSLGVLRMQLCHSAFSEVLFKEAPERVVSNENWVFDPLEGISRRKGESLGIFEVEVDWPDGGDGWDGKKEKGFTLTRVGPRARVW